MQRKNHDRHRNSRYHREFPRRNLNKHGDGLPAIVLRKAAALQESCRKQERQRKRKTKDELLRHPHERYKGDSSTDERRERVLFHQH